MFERYTQTARRVIFFARYEASKFGSPAIETEHLLLGIIASDRSLVAQLLREGDPIESLRNQIEAGLPKPQETDTSGDLPLSMESKRVLAFAAEEAAALENSSIGVGHLLLGLLREQDDPTEQFLRERGFALENVRVSITKSDIEKN